MCEDPAGNLWIGPTVAGLRRFQNGAFLKTYLSAEGIRDRSVFSLAIDHDQRLWIGEGEAVDMLEKSTIKPTKGENPQKLPNGVLCLYADAGRQMWRVQRTGSTGLGMAGGRLQSIGLIGVCSDPSFILFSKMTMAIFGQVVLAEFSLCPSRS
ncbi:MAG: hypothetical protein JOZ08_02270 [Verrucomicrobia bacterium]|nr:hypothetical protein [Verrucomicrobiota bacterium]